MDLISDWIPAEGQMALRAATHIQLVHSPELDTRFYQWLLLRARSGIRVEILLAGADGMRQADLNPSYFERLEQANGRIFLLPEKKSLPGMILLNDAALLQANQQHLAPGHFGLEDNPGSLQKLRAMFSAWKERGRIVSESRETAHNIEIIFQATPQAVEIHEHFELSWDVTGADQITITPLPGQVAGKGRQILSAEKTTEFRLQATNGHQTVSSVVAVSVNPAPKIEYLLTAAERTGQDDVLLPSKPGHPHHYGIVKGQVAHLYWRVYNARKISLDGKEVGPSGHQVLTPSQLQSYTIEAAGTAGTARTTLVIDAFPRPEIEQMSIATPIQVNTPMVLPKAETPAYTVLSEDQAPYFAGKATTPPHPVLPAAKGAAILEFFWFCSGASRPILRQCPAAEGNKYAGIGATVLFTGLLAALSGGYALYVAFQNPLAALGFGLLWGAAIFNLDRLIVSTIKKEAGPGRQWLQATPRFLLALILSIVIAKPMELRIFKGEIDEILAEKRAGKLNWTESLFREKAADIDKHIDRIKSETAASFQTREALYQEYRCECDGTCGTGKVGRGSECARKEAKYKQAAQEYDALKAGNDQLIEQARSDLDNLRHQEQAAKKEVEAVFADGLMARLNAARELPLLPSFFIALLIFMIEAAPVLSKILAPRGAYDEAMRVEEARFGLQQEDQLRQQQAVSDQGANMEVQLRQVELDEALEHKREILRIITGAQVQLVQEKVDRWLEEERKKLRE